VAGAATKLVMKTEPSSSVTAGATFGTQPAVNVEDQFGNVVTGNSSTVTATVATGTGPLTGTLTAVASSGVATFSGLGAPILAQTGLKLTFTDGSLASAVDATSITVNPGAISQLVMNPATIASATAGTPVSGSFVSITAEDANGNVCSSGPNAFTGTVTFGGTAGATGTSVAFTAGVLTTFPTLTPTSAGSSKTITATSGSVVGTTTITTVNPGPLDHFTVTTPGTQTAGTAFAITTITALDANGNTLSSGPNVFTGTVDMTETGGGAGGTVSPATSSAFVAGVRSGQSVTLSKSGTGVTITVTDHAGSGATGVSGTFTVNAGAATHLVYTTVPSTGIAGTAFSVTVQSQDANSNPSSPTSTTTITLSKASGGGTLSGTLTGTIATSANSVTISTPVYSKSDTMTLTATATAGETSLTAVTSGNIVFSPGAISQLVMNPATIASATAGTPVSGSFVSITAEDANGNVCSSGPNAFTGTVTFGGTAGATGTSVAFTAGVLSIFPTLTPTVAGSGKTITATSGSVVGTTTITTVNPGAATKLAYTSVPGAGTVGTAFSVTVQSQDANGNPASPTSNTTITLSKATGAGTLSGTLTGTILTSGNSVTISTPVYSAPDTMTLTATATAGMTSLTPVTSGNIVFSATFGIATVGSTSYQTNGNYVGYPTPDSTGQDSANYLVADQYTTTVPLTAIQISTYGNASGNVKVTIYGDNSGVPGTRLFTEVASAVASGTWSTITIPFTYLPAGTYWIAFNSDTTKAVARSASTGSVPRKWIANYTYATAFPDNSASWVNATQMLPDCIFFVGVPVEGYAKATRATLPAASAITSMSFYTHATGDFRLAIYSDSSGAPGAKQWESGSTAASASAWNTVNISAGTPTSLTLNAGTYWLAWQWDSANSGPSYALGSANTGDYLVQTYGSFPGSWSGGTLSTENWSLYATYSSAPATKLVINSVNSGADPTAGTGFNVVVQAQDAFGDPANVLTGTAVSLSLNNGSGTLSGTLTGTISAGANSATISGVTYTKAESGVILTAARTSGDSLSSGNSSAFTVDPGAVTQLAMNPTTISSATAGTSVSGSFVSITAEDANGNVCSSGPNAFTGTVTFGGTAGATGTSVAFSAGVLSTFPTLTLTVAGGGETITATSGSVAGTTTITTVNPGAMIQLVVNPTTISSATAGSSVSGSFTSITAKDANGNVCSSGPNAFTGTVTFGGTAGASGTSVAFTAGVLSTFPTLTPTVAGSGKTITATSGSVVGTTTITTVNPGAPSKLAMKTEPSSSVTAGGLFSTQPAVYVEDTYGNVVTSDSTSTVTASVQAGTGPLTGSTTAAVIGGVATFSGLAAPTKAQTGLKLTLTDSSSGSPTLNDTTSITVTAAVANKLAFTTQPSGGTGGMAWSQQPAVTLEDQYGNTVTGTAQNVTLAIQNNAGGGTLSGNNQVPVNTSTGVATFIGLSIDKGGNGYTLTATGSTVDTTAGTVVSSSFNVMSASPVAVGRAWGTDLRIPVATVTAAIAGGTTPYTVQSVTSLESKDYVAVSGSYILFAPAGNTNTILSYTVVDSTTPTPLTASSTITVTVTNAFGLVNSISSGGNSVTLTFAGIPTYKYVVQRSPNSGSGPWTDLDGTGGTPDSRTNAPTAGVWTFTDPSPTNPSFYRLRQNN
jgi:hypothetical protein